MATVDRLLHRLRLQGVEQLVGKLRRNEVANPNYFPIFFGTTLENFLTCTNEDEAGNIFFVKSREPRHQFPNLQQFTRTPISAAQWAVIRAEDYASLPLILEGSITKDQTTLNDELLPGVPFPARRVWVARPRANWASYNNTIAASQHVKTPWTNEVPELTRLFVPRNPHSILHKYRR